MTSKINESAINYMPGFGAGYERGYKDGYAQIVNELIKTKMRQPLEIAFCFNCGKKLKEVIKNEK